MSDVKREVRKVHERARMEGLTGISSTTLSVPSLPWVFPWLSPAPASSSPGFLASPRISSPWFLASAGTSLLLLLLFILLFLSSWMLSFSFSFSSASRGCSTRRAGVNQPAWYLETDRQMQLQSRMPSGFVHNTCDSTSQLKLELIIFYKSNLCHTKKISISIKETPQTKKYSQV